MRFWKSRQIFIPIAIFFIVLVESGFIPNQQPLGFYCGDPKISHKFKGDTISPNLLLFTTFLLPLFVLLVTEWCIGKRVGSKWSWLKQSIIWYRDYLSCLILMLTVIVTCKVLVGEPRPHFLDTCRPKEALNCTTEYIGSYHCMNKKASDWFVRDASKSFPSGHSAFSVYMFTFLAWFLQKRLHNLQSLVLIWMQTVCFLWAMLCSLSRITDHRHHWWDVLVGTIIGFTFASCCVKSLTIEFTMKEHKIEGIPTGHKLYLENKDRYNTVRHL